MGLIRTVAVWDISIPLRYKQIIKISLKDFMNEFASFGKASSWFNEINRDNCGTAYLYPNTKQTNY